PPSPVDAEVHVQDAFASLERRARLGAVCTGRDVDQHVLAARLDAGHRRADDARDRQALGIRADQRLADEHRAELGGVAVDAVAFGHYSPRMTRLPGSTRKPAFSRTAACSERSAGTPFTCTMRNSRWRRRPARWRRPSTARATSPSGAASAK